jgi:hypothetical protein
MKPNPVHGSAAIVAVLLMAALATAQSGHPLKGTWSGDWGPSEDHRNRVLLVLDWNGGELTGVINPGPEAVPLTSATLDASDWSVRLQAVAPDRNGNPVEYSIEGKIENLGSWTNRRIVGTWSHGGETGDFLVVMN